MECLRSICYGPQRPNYPPENVEFELSALSQGGNGKGKGKRDSADLAGICLPARIRSSHTLDALQKLQMDQKINVEYAVELELAEPGQSAHHLAAAPSLLPIHLMMTF